MKHYDITLTGDAQHLGVGLTEAEDLPFRELLLQPQGDNANPIYVGGDDGVTTSSYGARIEAGDGSDVPPVPLKLGPYEGGPLKLSRVWVIGTADEVLHVLGVPF